MRLRIPFGLAHRSFLYTTTSLEAKAFFGNTGIAGGFLMFSQISLNYFSLSISPWISIHSSLAVLLQACVCGLYTHLLLLFLHHPFFRISFLVSYLFLLDTFHILFFFNISVRILCDIDISTLYVLNLLCPALDYLLCVLDSLRLSVAFILP